MAATHESVCPLDCPDTCSLSVTVDAGRITKVDGSRPQPADRRVHLRQGAALSRSASTRRCECSTRSAASARRVRGGSSASVGTRRLDTIAERVQAKSSRRTAPEAILPYHYGGSNGLLGEGAADARFFNRLGASELLKTICAAPTGTAYRAMFGTMGGVPMEDYDRARAIILWGVNPSATSIHLVPHVHAARRAGAFVAVIDPRRTPLARTASLHLQPLPGTDVVLALAMINELVRTGRADHEFLGSMRRGLTSWRAPRRNTRCSAPRRSARCRSATLRRWSTPTPRRRRR